MASPTMGTSTAGNFSVKVNSKVCEVSSISVESSHIAYNGAGEFEFFIDNRVYRDYCGQRTRILAVCYSREKTRRILEKSSYLISEIDELFDHAMTKKLPSIKLPRSVFVSLAEAWHD